MDPKSYYGLTCINEWCFFREFLRFFEFGLFPLHITHSVVVYAAAGPPVLHLVVFSVLSNLVPSWVNRSPFILGVHGPVEIMKSTESLKQMVISYSLASLQ